MKNLRTKIQTAACITFLIAAPLHSAAAGSETDRDAAPASAATNVPGTKRQISCSPQDTAALERYPATIIDRVLADAKARDAETIIDRVLADAKTRLTTPPEAGLQDPYPELNGIIPYIILSTMAHSRLCELQQICEENIQQQHLPFSENLRAIHQELKTRALVPLHGIHDSSEGECEYFSEPALSYL